MWLIHIAMWHELFAGEPSVFVHAWHSNIKWMILTLDT
jgi:hypothetical protein